MGWQFYQVDIKLFGVYINEQYLPWFVTTGEGPGLAIHITDKKTEAKTYREACPELWEDLHGDRTSQNQALLP